MNLLATFLGVANATLKGLPANHAPFISINALCLSSSSVNLTNPKHLDFPDIGSVITRTVLIELGKFFWKNANKCASVVDADKSPTNKEYSGVCTIGAERVAPLAQFNRKYFFWLSGLLGKFSCEGIAISGNNCPFKLNACWASSNDSNSTKQ